MVLDVIKVASLEFYMRAFTLIEMLVTVSIIAIITTYTVINLSFQRDDRQVEQAAREFYSNLSYMRNFAVSGKIFPISNSVPNGYGVYFKLFSLNPDTYSYLLHADTFGNPHIVFVPEYVGSYHFLSTTVKITLRDPDTGLFPIGADSNWLNQIILFNVPDGKISYWRFGQPTELTFNSLEIIFSSNKDPSVKMSVVINKKTGQMYVNENP